MSENARRGWRVTELSTSHGGSETAWLEAIRRGDLVARRIGKRTLIVLQEDLDEFLERSRTDKQASPTAIRGVK